MTAELAPTEFAEELLDVGGAAQVLGRREARGMPIWRGLISPKRRCGDSREVPSRSGRSRSPE